MKSNRKRIKAIAILHQRTKAESKRRDVAAEQAKREPYGPMLGSGLGPATIEGELRELEDGAKLANERDYKRRANR